MMKIMISSTWILMILLYKYNKLLLFMSNAMLFMMMLMLNFNLKFPLNNMLMMMDNLSLIMIMLTLISIILIMMSSYNINSIITTILLIMTMLIMMFLSKNMIMFYILFELILIPTMILITMNGKQPERLQASIYLITYTIMMSLPLMMMLIFSKKSMSFYLANIAMMKFYMILFMMLAFLIKMPMYLFHLWLPKAHVEAPLEGSMILAAILLKLGGYGIIRFMPMCISSINKMNFWIISISMTGAIFTSLNCIRQKDLKSLIAYSSVAHMGFVMMALFTMNHIGLTGAIIMMVAHGLCSSAMFVLVNDLYMKYHTRNILMFKGLLTLMPNITFWWFIFMSMNISAPPTINTFSEIMMLSSLLLWNKNTMLLLFLMSLLTASFSTMMFINIIHNKNMMFSSNNSYQKTYMSLYTHMIPSILLIFKMDIMHIYYSSLFKTMVCGTMISNINFTMVLMMMLSLTTMYLSLMLMQTNLWLIIKMYIINMSSMAMSINLMLDWMSLLFLSTVMLVSSLIIFFSKYYIPLNQQKQFLMLLLMFVLSMSILIISNNLFLILLGWDGLGLSSYMLVVYYQNFSSSSSGTITLLSNRMGDIMILLSMSMLTISSNWNFTNNFEFTKLVTIMLMIAACSKSAQFPFSAWLPMAMAAPTPISALVHSSTLVTAGVFLMLRIYSHPHPSTTTILLIISSFTVIYASMSANWEQDMKKIIALSTLSQIAMMMFAISTMSTILAFMHLIIHALFKSAMFLCAGIMIHESSYQDMRMMSMNFKNSSMTTTMLGINSLALMGVPFMSGFFSKDMIIENMISSKLNMIMFILMILSIGMTASYSIRMTFSSNKFNTKYNTFSYNHQSIESYISIAILSAMAISSGSWLSWLLMPEQMFMMNLNYKIVILFTLTLGIILGFLLQFKNKKYIKTGLSSISLWFIHLMSIYPTKLMFPMMSNYQMIDKNWQEMYGPNNSFIFLKNLSKMSNMHKLSKMMTIIMITIIPTLILM